MTQTAVPIQEHPALKYFRHDSPGVPHVWCEGCGIGILWYYTIVAIEELGLDPNKVAWVGGSGCTGRMCTYWNYDYMHTLHGRPLGFATGIKLARPELTVICHMGDGEVSAIGGNHLIQTARRNVDLVAIVNNNFNYGMTGGQFSPTTPLGGKTMTSPEGQMENPFDLCKLVETCGATYVARWTIVHNRQCINSIKKAIQKKGFSFVEVVSQCVTAYGRRNKLGDGPQMMKWLRESSVRREQAEQMNPEELKGKLVVGEFVDRDAPEYGTELRALAQRRGGNVDE
jgi:2-oxoglutarate ferredoxin oxidoreductase subunit beta